MMVFCIILGILTVISMASLFIVLHDIKEITNQIEYKNKTKSRFNIFIQSNIPTIKTLQRKVSELYERADEIEESALKKEKEMRTLMSGISHDIRTPLTSMKGYMKLIEETNDDEEKKKYYEIMEYRLDTLGSILEDLFVHSKISDSEYTLKKERIEIFPIICKVIASYYYDFENRKIEPIIHFSNEKLSIMANQDMLERMMHNLINNALKHGNNYFEIKEEDNKIYFINGVQNSETIELERIFDRFYQSDLSRHQNSTGLGLSIVKQIAEIHDWGIDAKMEDDNLIITIDFKYNEVNTVKSK